MTTFTKIISLFLVFTIFSCTNAAEPDLENILCEDVVTYTDCVKSIIDSNCISCHSSEVLAIAPFPLETYVQVKSKIASGNLLIRIGLDDGNPQIMPPTGKLTQANIDIINAWATANFPE